MTNPFLFDRPLSPGQGLLRDQELEELIAMAQGGQSVRLVAPRRYGKTTLLKTLEKVARDAHEMIPASVDCSRVTSLEDVVVRIRNAYERSLDRGQLRSVWRAVRRRLSAGAQLAVPGVASVGAQVAAGPRSSDLEALHAVLELPVSVHERTGQRCLVIFDEFQDLLTAEEAIDGLLRSHLQHHAQSASYVFAGSQPSLMDALFGDRRRPLFEQALGIELGPLPQAPLAGYVEAVLAEHGRDDLLDDVDALVAAGAGHPQRTMLLAHMLYRQSRRRADPLASALDAALAQVDEALGQTWAALTPAQRRVLAAVAAGHSQLTSEAALRFAGHGKGTQASVRDALVAATHLVRDADGRVRFVDPLLRVWIERGP